MRTNATLQRIPISDVRPGHVVWDSYLPIGTVARAWRAGDFGAIAYTTQGSSIVRHLSPFAPRGKHAGTVYVTAGS